MVSQQSPLIHPSLCSKGIVLNHKSDNNTLPKNLEGASCYLQCEAQAVKCYSKPLFRIWLQAASPASLPPITYVFAQFSQNFCRFLCLVLCCLLMGHVLQLPCLIFASIQAQHRCHFTHLHAISSPHCVCPESFLP